MFRFDQLSVEDRVLALSTVDLEIVRSVKRMLKKLEKHGQGLFLFESRQKEQITSIPTPSGVRQQKAYFVTQDYTFKSVRQLY